MSAAASRPASCHADLVWHGGRVGAAARLYPQAPRPWLDLSTGISSWRWPVGDLGHVWARLPEPEALAGLEAAAALAFGVDAGEVVAVPGSDLAIRLLGQIFAGRDARLLAPIFSGHRAAFPGAQAVGVEDVQAADLLVLANPNNPDGRVVGAAQLRGLGADLIVDEAFADTMPGVSILPERNGAVVLRSFGKFFGLAGVRLGFVIADAPVRDRLRALLGDWPVSGAAIAIGTAAYRDLAWQALQRERLVQASVRLDEVLAGAGLGMMGGTPLFRLVRDDRAGALFDHLASAGILVRAFAEDAMALRFGLPGSEEAWERLCGALDAWRNAG